MRIEHMVGAALFCILSATILFITVVFSDMILENQRVAWCAVALATDQKTSVKECNLYE